MYVETYRPFERPFLAPDRASGHNANNSRATAAEQHTIMSASANPTQSTMATAAEAPEVGLPVVEVALLKNNTVFVKWGERVSKQAVAGLSDTYTGSFHAVDSSGEEPFLTTFGNLLLCNGGVLKIGTKCYRIQTQQQPDGKLRCCFCIVVFKCCFEYETNSIYTLYI
jgi:hypothetical protein